MATNEMILTIAEGDGVIEVWMNWGDGKNRIQYSVPTGDQAAYPEAIESNRRECERKIKDYVDTDRKTYPGLTFRRIKIAK